MQCPSAARLLDLWEAGLHQPRAQWAQGLLAEMDPETEPSLLDGLTVGARNARLCAVRVALFGSRVAGRAACPRCQAAVESEFDVQDLPGAAAAEVSPAMPRGETVFHADTCDITYRLPTAGDLLAIAGCGDVSTARTELLTRCVLQVRQGGASQPVDTIEPAVLGRMLAEMERSDPGAEVLLALRCPDCGHAWSEPFDIVAFLWTEIDGWARRTLRDVHRLARAYGWTEPEILNLSATRRAHYLELADS